MAILELDGREDALDAEAEDERDILAAGQKADPYALIRGEIDDYYRRLRRLNSMDPSEVFQALSSISARMSEIRTRLIRVEGRQPAKLRTAEVDPLLEEVDRQFKFHSRLQATREMEASLIRGQV